VVPVKLRRREDFWWRAGKKRAVLLGAVPDPREDDSKDWAPDYLAYLSDSKAEEVKPGDVWEFRKVEGEKATQTYRLKGNEHLTVVGYGLWCPNERCQEGMHVWTHASDCKAPFGPCKHGGPSCWNWSGTIEDNDLTGQPSLWANHPGCGWHGFLRAGEMQSV
jgi:hypothetical protein